MEERMLKVLHENDGLKRKLNVFGANYKKLELQNRILKANISSLYKTAKSEIERKNNQIAELRNQLDDLILRRARNAQSSHGQQ